MQTVGPSNEAKGGRKGSAFIEWTILLLLVPGLLFGAVLPMNRSLTALGLRYQFVVTIGAVVFLGGIASVILTPIGIVWGCLHRPWGSENRRWLWYFASILSAFGVAMMFGRYAL